MAKDNIKAPAVTGNTVSAGGLQKADRSKFATDVNLARSFLPYWTPSDENGNPYLDGIVATPVDLEITDPGQENEWRRVEMIAGEDIECWVGSKEEGEQVIVRKGEHFNMSAYHALPLNRAYFPTPTNPKGFEFWIKPTEKVKVKSDPKKSLWKWGMHPVPSDVQKLQAAKDAYQRELAAALPRELRSNAQTAAMANQPATEPVPVRS